jgi:hypothetical protein
VPWPEPARRQVTSDDEIIVFLRHWKTDIGRNSPGRKEGGLFDLFGQHQAVPAITQRIEKLIIPL